MIRNMRLNFQLKVEALWPCMNLYHIKVGHHIITESLYLMINFMKNGIMKKVQIDFYEEQKPFLPNTVGII